MAMDPKQERALRDGTASVADQPRDTDIESEREQTENPTVTERPRPRRRTGAVADVRVNQEAGTPTDQMSRELGAEPVPEMGGAPQDERNPNLETRDDHRPGPPSRAFSLDAARDAAAMPNAAPRQRPIAAAKRAMREPKSRTVGQPTGARPRAQEATRGTARRPMKLVNAKGRAVKRSTAKRAVSNVAAPKRAGTKRTGTVARKRTAAKRPVSRAKRKR